jgi:hypothetical protein
MSIGKNWHMDKLLAVSMLQWVWSKILGLMSISSGGGGSYSVGEVAESLSGSYDWCSSTTSEATVGPAAATLMIHLHEI